MEAFDLIIDSKRMYAVLRATNKLKDRISDLKTLMTYLERNSIKKGVSKSMILKAFSELRTLKEERNYIIAKGKLPRHGENGKIQFDIDVSGKSTFKLATDNLTERVDYKQSMCISEIKTGDKIGSLTPPTQGEDGYNILGKALSAKSGKAAKINLGEGVELDQDGITIIATKKGRPILNSNTITVTAYYEVNGDVCYETGNISFEGHVYITGSILDGFSVKANSIEICGNVGNCQIHSSGDLIIRGGINGHNSGTIKCLGSANIKYANNAVLIVNKDLNVEKGIINSTVKCLGSVKTLKIRGGAITALKGILVHTIGSISGLPTFIEPGINYKIKEINETQMDLDLRIKTILSQFGDNFGNRKYFNSITNSTQQKVKDAYFEFKKIKKIYLKTLSTKIMISQNIAMNPISNVLISNKLYSDVTISTPGCFKHFTTELSGPIKLSENLKFRSIKVETCDFNFNNKQTDKYLKSLDKDNSHNSCFFEVGGVHTKKSLIEIDRKFNQMLDEQQFYICIIENDSLKKIRMKKQLKDTGIENIITVEELNDIRFALFEYSGKNVILLCRSQENTEETYKFLSEFINESMYYYAIIFDNDKYSDVKVSPDKEEHFAIIKGDFSAEPITEQLYNFGIAL